MDVLPGVFDGIHLILQDGELVPLSEISRGRLELKPYLQFPVEVIGEDGEMEESEMEVLYPHTAETAYEKNELVYGTDRPTRIYHYLAEDTQTVVRKPDLRQPHHVKTLGYRHLVLEMKDGSEIVVDVEGNCRYRLPEVAGLDNGQEVLPLAEFYDRPSAFVDIIKKTGLEVYTK